MFTDPWHSFYYISLIAAAAVSLLFITRVNTAFKWLAALVILTLVSELMAKYITFYMRGNSNAVYHIFTVIEFCFYAIIYKLLFNTKRWSKIILCLVLVLAFAEILNMIFLQPISTSNTNTTILESILLIFLSLAYFNRIRQNVEFNLTVEAVFWFNCAVLFYYAFNILIWGFHSIKVYQLKDPPVIIYYINLLFSGLLYLVYAAVLILNHRSLKKINNRS